MKLKGCALSRITDVEEILALINWGNFVQLYGDEVVSVTNCHSQIYNSHSTSEMTVKSFFESPEEQLYLKDWHFEKLKNVALPCNIKQDWMNEYFIDNDFKFLYIGKKQSWTPVHTDVYNSHSWSVNLVGRKLWYFFAPDHPHFDQILNSFDARHFKPSLLFTTYPGDVVWVPTGWAHQVHNLDSLTVSYNRNWCDGDNILDMAIYLHCELLRVKKELCDIPMNEKERHIEENRVFSSLVGISLPDFSKWMNEMFARYHIKSAITAIEYVYHGTSNQKAIHVPKS